MIDPLLPKTEKQKKKRGRKNMVKIPKKETR